jgi:hypothetical protein
METACDRYLAARAQTASDLAPAAVDASGMIQAGVKNAPAASPIPLKILATLTAEVPDYLVTREELASASEVLALLTGWFAGGIDEAPGARKCSR